MGHALPLEQQRRGRGPDRPSLARRARAADLGDDGGDRVVQRDPAGRRRSAGRAARPRRRPGSCRSTRMVGDAEQLGVLERHARRDALRSSSSTLSPGASSSSASALAPRACWSSLPAPTTCTSAGDDRARPDQALVVVGLLGDRRDGARDADAVGAHRHADRLAVRAEHVEAEARRRTCGRAGRRGRSRCRGRSSAARRRAGTGRPRAPRRPATTPSG